MAQAIPARRISYAATTFVAATAFPNGRTLHNLLALSVCTKDHKLLSVKNRATVERNLRLSSDELAAWIIVIDEISMMGAQQLAQVDDRLREVGKSESPFSRFGIILTGDFFRLSCMGMKPLYVAALETPSSIGSSQRRIDPVMGAYLFRLFRLCEFKQQMRAAAWMPRPA